MLHANHCRRNGIVLLEEFVLARHTGSNNSKISLHDAL